MAQQIRVEGLKLKDAIGVLKEMFGGQIENQTVTTTVKFKWLNLDKIKDVEALRGYLEDLQNISKSNNKISYFDNLENATKSLKDAWNKIKDNVPDINPTAKANELSEDVKIVGRLGNAYQLLNGDLTGLDDNLAKVIKAMQGMESLKNSLYSIEKLKEVFDIANKMKGLEETKKSVEELLSISEKLMAVNGQNVNFKFLPDESKAFLKAAKEYKSALEETGSEADETGEKILKLFNSLSKSSEGSEYLDSLSTPIENISEASKQAMEDLEKFRLAYEKLKSEDKSKYDSISSVADGESKKAEIIQTKNALKQLQDDTISLDLDFSTKEPLAKEIKALVSEYGRINAQIDAQIKGIQASNKDAVKQLESSLKSMSQKKLFTDEITNWKNDFADYIKQVKNGTLTYEEAMDKVQSKVKSTIVL